MSEQPTSYEEIIVRYGDFWARISPTGITIGYGGGELATFPTLEPLETLYSKIKRAWQYLNPPQQAAPRPAEQPKTTSQPTPKPEEKKT
jgi:hypothetical protein